MAHVSGTSSGSLFITDEAELNQRRQAAAPAPFEEIGRPDRRKFAGEPIMAHNDGRLHAANGSVLGDVAFTLVYDGEVAQTIDNALSEIDKALQHLRKLSIYAVDQPLTAHQLRAAQAAVDECLLNIEHTSTQAQVNGVYVLNGGVKLRAVDDTIPAFDFQKIGIANLGLQGFNVAGPRTFVTITDLYLNDSQRRPLPLFNTAINLTVDGIACEGRLRQDGFEGLFVEVAVDSTQSNAVKPKFYKIDKSDIDIVERRGAIGPSTSLTLNIRNADLSFPTSLGPLGGPLGETSPHQFPTAVYLRDSNGRRILNVSADVKINGAPSAAELVADMNLDSFVKIAKGAVGNPSNQDGFYPVGKDDFAITQGPNAREDAFDSKAVVSLDIRSSDLRSAINNGPLEVIESALVKISQLYDALNALDPEHTARRID